MEITSVQNFSIVAHCSKELGLEAGQICPPGCQNTTLKTFTANVFEHA